MSLGKATGFHSNHQWTFYSWGQVVSTRRPKPVLRIIKVRSSLRGSSFFGRINA